MRLLCLFQEKVKNVNYRLFRHAVANLMTLQLQSIVPIECDSQCLLEKYGVKK